MDEEKIAIIKRMQRLDPSKSGIFVKVDKQ